MKAYEKELLRLPFEVITAFTLDTTVTLLPTVTRTNNKEIRTKNQEPIEDTSFNPEDVESILS